jgi:hypothetical protein
MAAPSKSDSSANQFLSGQNSSLHSSFTDSASFFS